MHSQIQKLYEREANGNTKGDPEMFELLSRFNFAFEQELNGYHFDMHTDTGNDKRSTYSNGDQERDKKDKKSLHIDQIYENLFHLSEDKIN